MRKPAALILLLMPFSVYAQEHGHSHGTGGEVEHIYPALLLFVGLIVAGGLVFLFGNKKKK